MVSEIQVGNRTYTLGDVLGVGGFSEVRKGVDKDTRKRVALKLMYQEGSGPELKNQLYQVQQEIKAMKKLQHTNLIRLLGYDLKCKVDKRKAIVMVQQLAPKGELFDYLMYTKKFDEPTAVAVFHQLIAGLAHMHEKHIAHRDLKPENLLFDNQFNLKLADFGFSKIYKKGEGHKNFMNTELGTKGYMAPEILSGEKYCEKVDIFAAGVILFIMLAGFPPFQNANEKDWWFDKITKKKYKLFWMAHERTAQFSKTAKDLLVNMLAAKQTDRYDVHQVQQHAFWNLPCPDKNELASLLKDKKRYVDRQKEKEKMEAAKSRDTLIQILVPEGKVTASSAPLQLKNLLKNDVAEKLTTIGDDKNQLKELLTGTWNTTEEMKWAIDLNQAIEEHKDIKGLCAALAELSSSRGGLEELNSTTKLDLGEKVGKKVLAQLHSTKMGQAVDDWDVAQKFVQFDDLVLPTYDPAVFKTFTYKTKISFALLCYTLSTFIKQRGVMKVNETEVELTMAIKKKVILPQETEEKDENGEPKIQFQAGKITAHIKMKISMSHDPISETNVVVFENVSDSHFTMTEFVACVKELTTNRKYTLAAFLEECFDAEDERLEQYDADWEVEFVEEEEVETLTEA